LAVEFWLALEAAVVLLSVPVLALEYYWTVLVVSSLRYPLSLGEGDPRLGSHPTVSVVIATFNEKYVIGRSLDAIARLDYPKDRLQVVVADDSTDDTAELVDEKVMELSALGIRASVSRRTARDSFKCGALNTAMERVDGEYVLLLDADSMVTPEVLTKGLGSLAADPEVSFVSFRYGHYNRDYNTVTKLFALTQDIGDTISKMGAHTLDAPFSFQGGLTLVRAKDLRDVGLWTNQRIADDADISVKMYLSGKKGVYLSGVKVMGEDPSTLEAWKKQVARTTQGWWRCFAHYWWKIVRAPNVSVRRKAGLLLMLTPPFVSLSWVLVTFLSAVSIVFNLIPTSSSVFNSPLYVALVSVPVAVSLASGVWALKAQGIATARNAVYIPMLSYAQGCMLVLGAMGFYYGVFDRVGFFLYRTPKSGAEKEMTKTSYFRHLTNDRKAILEGTMAILGLVLAWFVLLRGVWFLSLSMAGFGFFTLKSMNLSRHFPRRSRSRVGTVYLS
jgi:cellulose synthase/poly-beta-1,6-N-acetylglucosamine synthase-like glycosyltransferase